MKRYLLLRGMHPIVWIFAFGLFPAGCSRQAATIVGERCLDCHGDMSGFMPGHDPTVIGCASCHLGDADATLADVAHTGMVRIPGNLDTAGVTCGTTGCHPGIDLRVNGSLMNTMRGIVSVDRYAFGEASSPDGATAIQDIDNSPADTHLRNLCASCHLGATKTEIGPVHELTRGGGCLACHLNYDHESLRSYARGGLPAVHPQLSLQVSNQHCFGCHSRSGRISTSYEGWHETLLTPAQANARDGLRVLADERVFRFVAEDVHHAAGLDCIDCHHGMEIMGDGQAHLHKEDAVSIACEDCHLQSEPQTRPWAELLPDEQRMVRLRGQSELPGEFLVMKALSRTLTNARVDEEGRPILIGKNNGKRYPMGPPADACTRGSVHDALSCSACHTGWAPQCISCHTSHRPDEPGWDLLNREDTTWRWHEVSGLFFAGPPTLGVRQVADGDRQVIPFVPGMILDLQLPEASTNIHHRWFAPTEAHTTASVGRDCKSCHLDPVALGYGRGSLVYADGAWSFTPELETHPADGLPLDAWIGFREEVTTSRSTRTNARPFSGDEQKAILGVGRCLTCHDGPSEIMQASLSDFDALQERQSPRCRTGNGPENRPGR